MATVSNFDDIFKSFDDIFKEAADSMFTYKTVTVPVEDADKLMEQASNTITKLVAEIKDLRKCLDAMHLRMKEQEEAKQKAKVPDNRTPRERLEQILKECTENGS